MKPLRLAVLLSVALLPLHAVDPALLNMARPDANLVIGLDVAGFTSSALFQEAMQEAGGEHPDLRAAMALLGPTVLQNLHEIVVSARVEQFDKNTKPKDFLIAARGSFSGSTFRDLLCRKGCDTEDYRDLQILKFTPENGDEDVYFTTLDERYAAMGSRENVREAVDRRAMGTHSVLDATLRNSITRLSPYHLWLATRGPLQKTLAGSGNPMMPADAASKIDGLGIGIRLGANVDLAVELLSVSDADAKQFHDMANGFLALMKAGETTPENAALLNSLQLRQNGRTLSASMSISAAQIRAQMAQKAAGMQSGSGVAAAEPAPYAAPPAPKPVPRRAGGIRIFGLDEEPVEVPTQKR